MMIYLSCWILITCIMYFTKNAGTSIYFILSQTVIILGFLLLVFLGPQIKGLKEAEEKTRKRYEKLQDDIFKQPWLDAVSNRNRYYLLTFLFFAFFPFFWTCYMVYSNNALQVTQYFAVIDTWLVLFTAGFEGFIALVYTLFSQKPWYFFSVPLYYGIFFIKVWYQSTVSNFTIAKNYLICFLLLLWNFLYLSKTSFLWNIPFLFFLPILFMT
jgi:hypothetical protein